MKKVIIICVLVLLSTTLWAQSNDMLDKFLALDEADTATSLLLVAQAIGDLPIDAGSDAGYRWGMEQDFAKHVEKREPEDPISLGLFYLALLKGFDVEGGIWFKAIGSPRYAAMEAEFMGYVEPSSLYYTRSMAPYEVLTGLTYVIEDSEEGRL